MDEHKLNQFNILNSVRAIGASTSPTEIQRDLKKSNLIFYREDFQKLKDSGCFSIIYKDNPFPANAPIEEVTINELGKRRLDDLENEIKKEALSHELAIQQKIDGPKLYKMQRWTLFWTIVGVAIGFIALLVAIFHK